MSTFSDLPDSLLLCIFSFVAQSREDDLLKGLGDTEKVPPSEKNKADPPKSKKSKKGGRVAGLGARSLCRLCCCSQRLNHLASADQLWQPLTLDRFPDRHWLTTDQKNLEMIRVRRKHQLKLLQPSSGGSTEAPEDTMMDTGSGVVFDDQKQSHSGNPSRSQGNHQTVQDSDSLNKEEHSNKKQKRTKFYSRFEQRAHRRKFASLDPELKYTPLAWTNTFWNWKRTFFGDCRFVESKDVKTPNRIDHAVHRNNADSAREECDRCWRPKKSCICSALTSRLYCNCRARIMILQHPRCQVSIGTIRILKTSFKYCQIIIGKDFKAGRSLELDQALEDPNCTPLLLYPSHSAADIHTLVQDPNSSTHSLPNNGSLSEASRYCCKGCIHTQGEDPSSLDDDPAKPYRYKLIIALDGSWSHAKIMFRCNPRLQMLTQIKFPSPPQSIYHALKPEPKVAYTSTAEAVGQAVALLGWPTGADGGSDAKNESTPTSYADMLLEDLIRPLKKMIEIQDTIEQDRREAKEVDEE